MNMRFLATRLQTALCYAGRRVKIDQKQIWSDKTQRMVTKYLLLEEIKTDEGRKNVTILETYKLSEIVKTMAAMYGGD